MTRRRSLSDLIGEPTETEKAVALIEARARAQGDFDGHTMNARAFAERYAGKLLFVPELKTWFEYDGIVWAPASVGVIMQGWAAEREQEASEAWDANPNEDNKFDLKHARALLHKLDNQEKTLRAASQLPSMCKPLATFDQDAYLLAVANGVLNLRTGKLVPARPDQYLMRRAPVTFDAGADCPEFMAYLRKVQPDPNMREFLQRATGYTLMGDASEERFFFAHGEGATGKSLYVGVLVALLGPFAVNIPSQHLTASRHNVDPERVHARLIGARLALSNETREGTLWNEVLLKELSAHDQASARELYKGAVDYTPTHTLWIRGNHVPGSLDSSDGLSRRYTPIGFNVVIPEGERDKGLLDRIKAEELSGVLNWALAGARKWSLDRDLGRDGLRIPDAVKREREQYKSESDWFGQWLSQCTVPDVEAKTPTQALYDSYRAFCMDGGVSPPSKITFGRSMSARGFKQMNASGKHPPRYFGVALTNTRKQGFEDHGEE